MNPEPATRTDIAIVGAGAAGLFAAMFAGRAATGSVMALDSARILGAKILVAGGGRCNVTHAAVSEAAYAGSSRNAIRKILRRFDVPQTIEFFQSRGVNLKTEPTGKLFPVSDNARTILDTLLNACRDARVSLEHPFRVEHIARRVDNFEIHFDPLTPRPPLIARKLILATGGKKPPKTGSDGHGHALARSLGHTISSRIFPALVPLTLPANHPLTTLSGLALPMTLHVIAGTGKRLISFTNSCLCTHFGISGPGPLDISRHLQHAQLEDPAARLVINFLPGRTTEELDAFLTTASGGILAALRTFHATPRPRPLTDLAEGVDLNTDIPERLIRLLASLLSLDASTPCHRLTREQRKSLAATFIAHVVPVTGTRGYTYAEVTAGGVPLSELNLDTLESRICENLHICGELCDVDGRIGGYNFQWAWASGFVAGSAAANLE